MKRKGNEPDDVVGLVSIEYVEKKDLRHSRIKVENQKSSVMCYVDQGQSDVRIGGNYFKLEEGSLIIHHSKISPEEDDFCIRGGIVHMIMFAVESEMMNGLYNKPIKLNLQQRYRYGAMYAKYRALFSNVSNDDSLFDQCPPAEHALISAQEVKLLMSMFLLDLLKTELKPAGCSYGGRKERFHQQQMEILTTFLMEHIGQSLTLEQMSAAVYQSESTLRRLVHKYKGCGPVAYFRELKIQEAKRLIETEDLSITQISNQLGFSTIHYFSRTFKNVVGMTPTEYSRGVK